MLTERINFAVTPRELNRIKDLAVKYGMPVSALLRLAAMLLPADPEEIRKNYTIGKAANSGI